MTKVPTTELPEKPWKPLDPKILLPHPNHIFKMQENAAIPSLWNGVPYYAPK